MKFLHDAWGYSMVVLEKTDFIQDLEFWIINFMWIFHVICGKNAETNVYDM